MLPEIGILKDRIKLYDNVAKMGEYEGRLLVELRVHPLPQIVWEFEALGDEVNKRGRISYRDQGQPLRGYRFSIDQPVNTNDHHDLVTPAKSIVGRTTQAIYGDLDYSAHAIKFYLPNARFQATNRFGQQRIYRVLTAQDEEISQGVEGYFIDASLDDTWHLRLETRQSALEWLDEQKGNIGTQITTVGYLHSKIPDDVKFTHYPVITLRDALDRIQTLSVLLSHANGGYISPLYVEGIWYFSPRDQLHPSSAIVLAYNTTPLELVGNSWLVHNSNLAAFLSCFPTLQRMLTTEPWDEAFNIILSWYFQAIQPENAGMDKAWPIIANAVGTALERLSYTILVLDEIDPVQRTRMEKLYSSNRNKQRLRLLLERIGLSLDRGYWDTNEVNAFVDLRNEATHPKKGTVDRGRIFYLLQQALQWIDEVLLWRLGYNGTYWNRAASGRQPIGPRYDLSTRNPRW